MARLLYEVQGVRDRDGDLATGVTYEVYSDEAATSLADISATSGGSAIAGSTVVVADIAGLGPSALRWWGPPAGTDELYLKAPSDPTLPVQRVEAVTDQRLDALEAALGGTTPAQFARRDQANTFTASNTFNADAYFKSGRPWADVRAYGATGDGSTNDHAAIQAAIDAVAASEVSGVYGGIVLLPKGKYMVSAQLQVKAGVQLVGAGRGGSWIQAINGTFPPSTALIRLGTGGAVELFGMRVENLIVDCNNIAGSTGIYGSAEPNEQSGVFRCLVINYRDVGIHFDPGSIVGVECCELYPSTSGSNKGIYFESTAGQNYVRDVTIGQSSGTHTTAIDVASHVHCQGIHVEQHTNGVYYSDLNSAGTVQDVHGNATVTNLVRLASDKVACFGIVANGATNSLVDDVVPLTLTSASWPILASYFAGRVRIGGVTLRHQGTEAVLVEGGEIVSERSIAAANVFRGQVTGDAFSRLYVWADGKLFWGPGSAGPDATLERSAVGVLTATAALKITGSVGFYGTTPAAKPTVTGSRGGNAALASLLTGLASLGLITDSSS